MVCEETGCQAAEHWSGARKKEGRGAKVVSEKCDELSWEEKMKSADLDWRQRRLKKRA